MPSFILNNQNAILAQAGYSCDSAIFLSLALNGANRAKFFITDGRYAIEAKELAADDVEICCTSAGLSLIAMAARILRRFNIKRLEFDPISFNVLEYKQLRQKCPTLSLIARENLGQKLRIAKSKSELEKLKIAAQIGASCFDEFGEYLLKNGKGKSEAFLQQKAVEIFSSNGKRELSFNPIFAIGENAAKAHALPSHTRKLNERDLVLLDAGVKYEGFCSDRTRTAFFSGGDEFSFNKKQSFKNEKMQKIYELVLKAQSAAIAATRPGIAAKEIDFAARDIINKAGYKEQFFHSTGHGVGLDIHELPRISKKSDEILKPGMVFSIEPGIYLAGEFGIRIEDVVALSQDGCVVL